MKLIILLFAISTAHAYVDDGTSSPQDMPPMAYRNMYPSKKSEISSLPGRFPEVFIEILDEDLHYSYDSYESSEGSTAQAASDELGRLSPEEGYAAGLRAAKEGARWAALTFLNATQKLEAHSAMMRVYAKWSFEHDEPTSLDKQIQCNTIGEILTDYDYYIPDGYNDVVNGWLLYCP